jgi:hypothetical protein
MELNLDLKNLDKHVVTNKKSVLFKKKVLSALKATKDISKKTAYTLV